MPDVVHIPAVLGKRAARSLVDRPEGTAYPGPSTRVVDEFGIGGADGILALCIEEEHLCFPRVAGVFIRCVQMADCQGTLVEFCGIGEIVATVLEHETVFVFTGTLGSDHVELEQWRITLVLR